MIIYPIASKAWRVAGQHAVRLTSGAVVYVACDRHGHVVGMTSKPVDHVRTARDL